MYTSYWLVFGYYFIPIIIILIFFCLTSYNLKRYLIKNRNLENSVVRMMLIQMSLLILSGIPAAGFILYILITQFQSRTLLRLFYENLINLVLTLFTFLTSRISFWVYLFVSKSFRKNVKEYFLTCKLFQIKQQQHRRRRTIHTV